MKFIPIAAVLMAFAAAASDAAAQNPMRPGRWEVTMQMEMPNMPMQMPAMKTTPCVTQEQIDGPDKALPSGGPGNPNACKVSDHKVSGNTVTWNIACSGPQPMTGTGEMHFKGDAYDGLMKMTMEKQEMTMKYSAKRLGDCTP